MKDRFSHHAQQYAQFRPVYPDAFYNFLFSHVTNFDTAWDAGTGNGQAARVLATRFKKVLATDISAKQLENATPTENIVYAVGAETTSLSDHSVDLITVAQAIHWFNIPVFFNEVKRVAKPDAIIAVWGYGLLQINPSIDQKINHFYKNVVGPYWDPERTLIDNHYRTIPFPFQEIESPALSFSFQWSLQQLEGYLNTWSAVRNYIAANHANPVETLIAQLQPTWRETLPVTFPMFQRIGRIN